MWYEEVSRDSDVVISTRARYARNIAGEKFPHMLNHKGKEKIIEKLEDSIDKNKYSILRLSDMDIRTKGSLAEKHLISKEIIDSKGSALITNEDCRLIAMINEEDHLRIQSFETGFNVDSCYQNLVEFTKDISNGIKFAENEKYGYITACPTCIGTGLRISVMLHLPGLAKLGLLNKLLEQAMSIGLSVRGIYGENTNSYGYIYQISNRKTLGISDEDIINNIKAIINTIIEQEKNAREILMKNSKLEIENDVYRAYGILKNARILDEEECIRLMSKLRFGVAIGAIEDVTLEKIQTIMNSTQSYTLSTLLKQNFEKDEENEMRAKYIREELSK
ncbi:MAG: ATP--guanido phosphotransferase [Clostridia bacterium]|nr:ATP--guanido phosphotransferase [Clostridia bacterium]